MRRIRLDAHAWAALVIIVVLAALVLGPAAAGAGDVAHDGWSVVPSPNAGTGDNRLAGVAAVSPHEAWAVGSAGTEALIESWDGTDWSVTGLPALAGPSALHGVDALPSGEAWAVGAAGRHPLVLHRQGTAWEVVPSPSVAGARTTLLAVTARSSGDVWAVGKAGRGVVVEHWDGLAWSIVAHPPLRPPARLDAVLALPSGTVWAVGAEMRGGWYPDVLSLRWSGSRWVRRAVPLPPSPWPRSADTSALTGLTAPGGVPWTAGYWTPDPGSAGVETLTLRWSSGRWHRVPSANDTHAFFTMPYAIDGTAGDDIWAVGAAGGLPGSGTFAMRWDGTSWSQADSPNVIPPREGFNVLRAVETTGGIDWAVGSVARDGDPSATLILRYEA
jgi:hypothetical protein